MNTIDLKSATVDYFHQAWHLGNEAALDKYLHPDTTAHGVGAPTRGLPAFRDWYLALVAAYPGQAQDPDLKWAQALGAIETVRGYREIRYKGMDECKARVQALVGLRG